MVDGKTRQLLEKAEKQHEAAGTADSCVARAARHFSSADETENEFQNLRRKLFQISLWNECSEISSFELFDQNGGAQPEKFAAVGDFIKVTLPGSGKADWVEIVEIYEPDDEIVLTVRPSHDPTATENKEKTSHFFTGDSTNNFCLIKENQTIVFFVIGLNEQTNTDDTKNVIETVRNFATAHLGRFLGIQKTQWETFCRNFLETNDK